MNAFIDEFLISAIESPTMISKFFEYQRIRVPWNDDGFLDFWFICQIIQRTKSNLDFDMVHTCSSGYALAYHGRISFGVNPKAVQPQSSSTPKQSYNIAILM